MSHIATITVEIRDLDALRAACTRIGCEFVENQTTYAWFGRSVALPSGYSIEDLGRCTHAIRVPGASYEVGVTPARSGRRGWDLLWDFWSSGGLERALGQDGRRLVQAYGVEAAIRAARRQGYAVTETAGSDGAVVLRLTGGAA